MSHSVALAVAVVLSALPHWNDTVTRYLLAGSLLLSALPAQAVDVDFAGYYRARGRAYQSLSIDRGADATNSEGLAAYVQHRVQLRPTFYVNDHIQVSADIRALDGVSWGSDPTEFFGLPLEEAIGEIDTLEPPDDGNRSNLTLWRAWAEVNAGNHTVRFGRMPLNWGSGIWWNDGLGYNADHGDTADRLQYEGLFGEIYVSGAIDVVTEGVLSQGDDMTAFNAMAAYRSETITAGVAAQVRHRPDPNLTVLTVDAAFDAEIGRIEIHGEGVARFGTGDLSEDITDIDIAAGGAVLDGAVGFDWATVGIQAGLATGDDDSDTTRSTFRFDRDFNVGIIMFEQPLPTIQTGGLRDTSEALSGNSVSNALFLKPRISRTFAERMELEGSLLWARALVTPTGTANEGRQSYGFEFDATARYIGMEHLDVGLTGAVFLPGSWYSELDGVDLSQPVFGAQLLGRVVF